MKYTVDIEINKPIDEVVKLFSEEDNLFKWMKGLKSIEHISGEPGGIDSKSKMIFKQGKREIEMIETIVTNNLPEDFTAKYEAKGVLNIAIISFVSKNENKTKYISEQEFQLKGFMKLFGWFIPGAFKKQTLQYLQMFKDFAEE